MMTYIKKKIKSFIKKIILVTLREIENEKIEENYRKITCSDKSTIIRNTARIINRQHNREAIKIDKNCVICGELMVMGYGGKIEIGKNCFIGEHTRIWSGEFIKIGNNVLISHNVNIIDTNSHSFNHIKRAVDYENLLKYGASKEKDDIESKSIIIDDYVWINFNSTILKGVKIGKGAIIASNTLVTKDVPPFTLVAGIPGKIIKNLNEQI